MGRPTVLPIDPERAARRRDALRSPTAAAVAGIIFALLYASGMVLVRTAAPEDPTAGLDWLLENQRNFVLALNLLPYSGIAFLWFMGVLRDRLGALEDQFMATVLMGSGLLFLAMMFVGGALAGGIIGTFPGLPETTLQSGLITYARVTAYQIINLYGVRMSAVFMTVSATLWWRTNVMPRWLALISYPAALLLLLNTTLSLWAGLVFPVWVLLVSILVLILNVRERSRPADPMAQAAS